MKKSQMGASFQEMLSVVYLIFSCFFQERKSFSSQIISLFLSVSNSSKKPFYNVGRNRDEEGGTSGLRTAPGVYGIIALARACQ